MLLEGSIETVREFDGSLTKRLVGHSGPVYSSKFMNPDGQRFLVSASQDGTARLWSLDTFSCVVIYRGHNCPIWDLDVSPIGSGPYFVTASADRTARLWSTATIHALRIFAGHLSDVNAVRFHPNGNYVISGSADKTCRMWDIQNGSCVRLFSGHTLGVSALAVSPDGRLLASADRAGQIRLWDLAEGRLIKVSQASSAGNLSKTNTPSSALLNQHSANAIYTLEFDRDGRILAAAGADKIVRIWDITKLVSTPASSSTTADETGLLASFPTRSTPIFKLYFTFRNVLLASGPFLPNSSQTFAHE